MLQTVESNFFLILQSSLTLLSDITVYKGLAPMGQSVMDIQSYKCQGPYKSNFSTKTPGGGATWHPGVLGHRLKAMSAAYPLLYMLDSALESIESAALTRGSAGVAMNLKVSQYYLARMQPTAKQIKPVVCSEECSGKTNCFTEYEPKVWQILKFKYTSFFNFILSLKTR